MDAVSKGHYLEGMIRPDVLREIEKICDEIKRMIPIGGAKSYSNVVNALGRYSEQSIIRAVDYLVKQEKISLRDMGRIIVRMP
jgi:DNA replication licensing factor MCM5